MFRNTDWFEVTLVTAIGIGVFVLAAIFSMIIVDGFKERQAFHAITACESRLLLPRRQYLSSKVYCVPNPVRRDTTALNLVGGEVP